MKIKLIQIDNFKVIKNFTADVNGRSFMLMGKNGVGKTSVEQFILMALGNTDIIPPGTDPNGYLVTTEDGNDFIFKVETKEGKLKVTVEGPDGMKVADDSKGKGKIAQIVGAMNFNPHKFIELSKTDKGRKEQVEIWKNTFLDEPTKKEILRLEENVKSIEKDRTDLGRAITTTEGAVKLHPLNVYAYANRLDEFTPVDITEITTAHAQAVKHNELVAKSIAKKESIDSDLFNNQKLLAEKQEALKKLQQEIESIENKISEGEEAQKKGAKWIEENPKKDTSDLDIQIKAATEANTKHKEAQELKAKVSELAKMQEEYGEYTANIQSQRQAIRDYIRQMDHSVDGLTINENELIYRDVPVHPDTLSESERIELAYKMTMAANPRMKFIFIEDSNLLDEDKWNALLELRDKYDMQIIGEEVVRGQKTLKIELIN